MTAAHHSSLPALYRSRWETAASAALCAFVAVGGGLFGGFDFAAGRPIVAILSGLALAVQIALLQPSRGTWRRLLLPGALLGAAGMWAVAVSRGAFGAPALVPDLAFPYAAGLAGVGAGFVTGVIVGADRFVRRQALTLIPQLAAALAILGFAVDVLGISLSDTMWQPGQQGRFAGTFGNANVAATVFAAAALLALTPWLRPDVSAAGDRTVLRGASAAILIAGCLSTASRMGATSLLLGVALPLLIRLAARRRSGWAPRTLVLWTLPVAIVLFAFSGPVLVRLGFFEQDWLFRQYMWRHVAALAALSPLLGHGLGSFSAANAAALLSPEQGIVFWPVNAAHNIVVGMIIEGGWPYAALITAAAALIGVRTVAAVSRGTASPALGYVLIAAAIIVLNALVDIALDVPAVSLMFWVLLGIAWGALPHPPLRSRGD